VTVNGQTQTTKLGGHAVFNLHAKAGDLVYVQVRPVRSVAGNKAEKQSEQAVQLNGSGHVEYVANFEGYGSFGQWPLVDFQGSVSLDVFVDGEVKGTTETRKGVRPDQKHEFEWKNGTSKVCNMEVTLPVNVRRTYLCDAATKKVKEQ